MKPEHRTPNTQHRTSNAARPEPRLLLPIVNPSFGVSIEPQYSTNTRRWRCAIVDLETGTTQGVTKPSRKTRDEALTDACKALEGRAA